MYSEIFYCVIGEFKSVIGERTRSTLRSFFSITIISSRTLQIKKRIKVKVVSMI